MGNKKGKSLYSLLWILFEKFGVTIIAVISFSMYAVMLSPAEFGEATIALSLAMGIGQTVATLFQDPLVCKKKLTVASLSTALFGSLLLTLSLVAIFVLISWSLGLGDLELLLTVAAIIIPILSINGIYSGILRRRNKFKRMSQALLVGRCVGATVGISTAWFGLGALSMVLHSVATEFVVMVCLFGVQRLRVKPIFRLRLFYEILSIGYAISLRKLSWEGYIKGLPVLIGATLGTTAAGIYSFAWRVVDLPRSAITSGAISFILPLFAKSECLKQLKTLYMDVTKVSMLLFAPIFIGLGLAIEPFLMLVFGDKWLDAVPVIQALALVVVLSHSRIYVPTLLTSLGTPQSTLAADIVSSAIALLACYLLFDEFGVLAAVLSQFIRFAFNYPFLAKQLQTRLSLGLIESNKVFLGAAIACLAMVTTNMLLVGKQSIEPLMQLGYTVALGLLIYPLFVALIDIKFIRKIVSRS